MNARDWFRIVRKEIRAIGPAWAVCALALLGAKVNDGTVKTIAVATYFVGPAALGALAIGHEYNYGTWSLLLAQPISRSRLLLVKLSVLGVLLIVLADIGIELNMVSGGPYFGRTALWLPGLMGTFVAPWLTMLVRRPIGGAVFTATIPGLLLIAGETIGVARYGYTQEVDAFTAAMVTWGSLVACGLGAMLMLPTFERLEIGDERGRSGADSVSRGRPARPAAASALRRQHPMWLLVWKEVRLQQLTLALAAVYAAGYLIAALSAGRTSNFTSIAGVLTVLYGGLIAMMAGASGSAEERELGTLESQLLMPVSARVQWTVKSVVVIGLAGLLAYVLPLTLSLVTQFSGLHVRLPHDALVSPLFGLILLLLAATSLYVSTVCTSALWALIMSLPVIFIAAIFVRRLADSVYLAGYRFARQYSDVAPHFSRHTQDVVALAMLGLFVMLIVSLGLSNHQFAERNYLRVGVHAVTVAILLTMAFAALGALGIH